MSPWAWVLRYRGYLAAALIGAGVALGAVALLVPRPAASVAIVATTPTPRPSPSPAPLVTVHVAGAVEAPGVYRLAADSRVQDAVTAAGGFAEAADRESLNLAARVLDGQQLVVRSLVPAATGSPGVSTAAGGRVRLNVASRAELESLPGVGPTIAQRIVDRRERQGPFLSLEQLRDEKIVNGPTLERLRDLVSLE
ncbi:MAG: ComEA family DNA-binding protein [Chloroflexi bacterium]|nr:ComEA family DNA-binding protein [Chloroflexota bacterium]